jgi:hypothetical protein
MPLLLNSSIIAVVQLSGFFSLIPCCRYIEGVKVLHFCRDPYRHSCLHVNCIPFYTVSFECRVVYKVKLLEDWGFFSHDIPGGGEGRLHLTDAPHFDLY